MEEGPWSIYRPFVETIVQWVPMQSAETGQVSFSGFIFLRSHT
jgi:hypothetical protein